MPSIVVGDPTVIVNLSDGLYRVYESVYWRALITGDSIYKGVTANHEDSLQAGLRQEFVQILADAGYRIDMVGPFSAGPLTFREKQHAALSGRQVAYAATNMAAWIAAYDPDVIVVGMGINNALQPLNDNGSPKTLPDILGTPTEMGNLIDQIHTINPRIWIVVPTLTPVNGLSSGLGSDGLGDSYQAVISAGYRTVVAAKITGGHRVVLAELQPTMTYAHISDGVHPNALGYTLMAQRISGAFLGVLTTWAGSNRSPVMVSAAAGSSGVLNVTTTAGHGTIESITVESVQNATVTFPTGGASAVWPRRYVPAGPVSTVPVVLTRQTAGLDVSARLVIVDGRGPWPVLVGAGPSAI